MFGRKKKEAVTPVTPLTVELSIERNASGQRTVIIIYHLPDGEKYQLKFSDSQFEEYCQKLNGAWDYLKQDD
jgi:hypothetical protein